jgi:hypothetical protein
LTFLYEHPLNERAPPSSIKGTMLKTPLTGVDSTTAILLAFGETTGGGLSAQAMLSCSIQISTPNPAVTIRFERGIIEIPVPIHSPRFYIIKHVERGKVVREEKRTIDFVGHGLHFQVCHVVSWVGSSHIASGKADEVARCVRSGMRGSAIWSHDDSLMEMTIFDEVTNFPFPHMYMLLTFITFLQVRRQGGYAVQSALDQ